MSAPAAKARSPLPVRITTRMAGSAARVVEGELQLVEHDAVEGVEDLGAVEGEGGDGAFEGAAEGGERDEIGHGVSLEGR